MKHNLDRKAFPEKQYEMLVKNMRQFEKKVLRKRKEGKHFLVRQLLVQVIQAKNKKAKQLTATTDAATCFIAGKFVVFLSFHVTQVLSPKQGATNIKMLRLRLSIKLS